MADLKYGFENDVLTVSDKDTGQAKTFNFREIPDAIRHKLGLHGLKVVLQQRTSQLRGKDRR